MGRLHETSHSERFRQDRAAGRSVAGWWPAASNWCPPGGTAKALADAGLPVVNVSDVTGFPEMMDGRVKTLHPKIHGGILARRASSRRPGGGRGPRDRPRRPGRGQPLSVRARRRRSPGIALRRPHRADRHRRPSLVRAAAKNFRDVLVVVSPADYPAVLAALDRRRRADRRRSASTWRGAPSRTPAATTRRLPRRWPRSRSSTATLPPRAAAGAPGARTSSLIDARKLRDLRYGENPHQPAAWYALDPAPGLGAPAVLQGKELSFTNLLDLDAAARIVLEFDEPAAVVIKHTNPCGAATGATIAEAYVRAREADALAAFGGIIGLNRPIDEDTATAIVSTFIEAVVAPGGGRGGAADPRDEGQPARGDGRLRRRSARPDGPARSGVRSARCSARCSCRSAIRWSKRARRGRRRACGS